LSAGLRDHLIGISHQGFASACICWGGGCDLKITPAAHTAVLTIAETVGPNRVKRDRGCFGICHHHPAPPRPRHRFASTSVSVPCSGVERPDGWQRRTAAVPFLPRRQTADRSAPSDTGSNASTPDAAAPPPATAPSAWSPASAPRLHATPPAMTRDDVLLCRLLASYSSMSSTR